MTTRPIVRTIANGPVLIGVSIALAVAARANASIYRGVDFPSGDISFADELVLYDPLFSGGPAPFEDPGIPGSEVDPLAALGPPQLLFDQDVALGNGGRIIVKFTDNALIGSGDASADLYIFEQGGAEGFSVDISKNGLAWTSLGTAFGTSAFFDIDAFGFGPSDQFFFVRLTDTPFAGPYEATEGADIDAVGAISTVAISTSPVPEPTTFAVWCLLGLTAGGVYKWRRQ